MAGYIWVLVLVSARNAPVIRCHFYAASESEPALGVGVDVAMLAARPSSVAGKMDRPLDRQTYFNFIRECPRHFLVRRKCQGVMKNLPCDDEAFPLPLSPSPSLSLSLSLGRCYSSGCSDSRVYVTAVPHNNVALRFNRRRLLFFTPQPPPLSPFRWTLLSAGRRAVEFVSRRVTSLFIVNPA